MSISGKTLYTKVCGLRPGLSNLLTPELLNKICDEPVVQPFLKWFCENLNYVNVVSDEDLQMELEIKLDEDIEKEEECLNRETIEANKAYEDCFEILRQFDIRNHEFFKEVKHLLNIYADAAENETNTSYEREKNILWQRFLMDPDTLRKIHQEVK
ncbi:hypothetical protein WN48_09969, partial [Eufriesea mexicana]